MTKEDSSPSLLSKMVKFVRSPGTSWSELDNKDSGRDESPNKQVLKDMIERKRRNDFVRKREFDMLRKMRKREAMVGQDPSVRPSFFQSSMPSKPDDRAQTLKKIDEIEAQMSMQWWQTKPRTSVMPGGNTTLPPPVRRPLGAGPTDAEALMPASYASTLVSDQPYTVPLVVPQILAVQKPPIAGDQHRTVKPATAVTTSGGFGKSAFDFGATNYMAVDVEELAHDAELEEAAIRFANSDDLGSELVLLEMLAPNGSRVDNSETWMALFDLYRGTDQKDKFESTAIDFVQRFDRSAPQWFSMLDMVRQLVSPQGKTLANSAAASWTCPSTMGIQTVAALKVALAKVPMPWRLDWNNLKSIDPAAVEPLCKVLSSWSAQPVQLRFMGDAQLQRVLQNATPSGQRETAQGWWQLRMEALRVMHRPDEFELAALDFCVTYEVSPPAWASARCEYKALDPEDVLVSGQTIIGDIYRDSVPSILSVLDGDSQMDSLNIQFNRFQSVELAGQVHGDAVVVLEHLEDKLKGADVLMISCAKLIRVDFSAAGTLLNWVSARQAEGRSVQFTDVNRLVAAFFNVIGITEHAKVVTRKD